MFSFRRPASPTPGPPRFFLYLEAALLLLLSLSLLSSYTKRYPLFNQTDSSLYRIQEESSASSGQRENASKSKNGENQTAQAKENQAAQAKENTPAEEKKFIKWVDFTVTAEALDKAFRLDLDTCLSEPHLNWIELLAYLGARYGGDFSRYKASDMDNLAQKLLEGESMENLTKEMKYYPYYLEAYTAVLDGMVGVFREEIPADQAPQAEENTPDPTEAPMQGEDNSAAEPVPREDHSSESSQESEPINPSEPSQESEQTGDSSTEQPENPLPEKGNTVWVTKYGLKAFSPIAQGFPYSDFDDFGTARSYGFKRQHLGHDMMGQVGTPIIAVESGTVEALGWNQYGGWRIGIRSFDKKRYYYYAHLRKNYPYQSNLEVGSTVQAGDVIGYMGRTGYSRTENTNNIDEPHLHFGLQLIFDESQKEGNNEIWISCYELVKFLRQNQCLTRKVPNTKEWQRVYGTEDKQP